MNWERDRLLLALNSEPVDLADGAQLKSKEAAEGSRVLGLYQSYCDFYKIDFISPRLAASQTIKALSIRNFDLVIQRFVPSRPSKKASQALLIHGYFDHAGLYGHLIRYLLKLGVEVLIFDLPGHGLSSGKRAAITNFSEYQNCIKAIVERELDQSRPINIIGQSTGAAAIADYFSSPTNVGSEFWIAAHVILFAPLLRPVGWKKAEFMHSLLNKRRDYWPRSFNENTHDREFLDFLKHKDPLQHHSLSVEWVGALREWLPQMLQRESCDKSMIIIQGTDDTTVDWQYNLEEYRRLFPLNKSVLIHAAGHHLVGESKEYRDKVFSELGRALVI